MHRLRQAYGDRRTADHSPFSPSVGVFTVGTRTMAENKFPDPIQGSMASFDISYNYRSSTKII
jgi:hypothetical protein